MVFRVTIWNGDSEINGTMTEDSGQRFYIKAVFSTIGRKGVAEFVVIMITNLRSL